MKSLKYDYYQYWLRRNQYFSLEPYDSQTLDPGNVCNCWFIYVYSQCVLLVSSLSLQPRPSTVLLLSWYSTGCGDVLEAGPQRDHGICPSVASEERPTCNRFVCQWLQSKLHCFCSCHHIKSNWDSVGELSYICPLLQTAHMVPLKLNAITLLS